VSLFVALVVCLDPFLYNLAYPHRRVHDYRTTPHPQSPYTPPRLDISDKLRSQFDRNGVVVLRNVFSKDTTQKMSVAYEDLRANQTTFCAVSQWAGPPTFGRYDTYCGMADMVHDYIRDSIYSSPMAHIASQLMNDHPVRLYRAHAMGANNESTIPELWHVDYPYFPGTQSCDNGVVFWVPLEESSYESNGLKVLKSKEFEEIVHNNSFGSLFPKSAKLVSWTKQHAASGEAAGRVLAPRLNFGDALVFSKCTIHSATGVNTLKRARRSLQFRFAVASSVQSTLYADQAGLLSQESPHWSTPLLWPQTLASEDNLRAAGPQSPSKLSLLRMRLDMRQWRHWVLVNFVYFIHVFLWRLDICNVDIGSIVAAILKARGHERAETQLCKT
jgi:ectoine hydroxylase-related dioxygenase (phytanoyl-CoA dioxygenase family)